MNATFSMQSHSSSFRISRSLCCDLKKYPLMFQGSERSRNGWTRLETSVGQRTWDNPGLLPRWSLLWSRAHWTRYCPVKIVKAGFIICWASIGSVVLELVCVTDKSQKVSLGVGSRGKNTLKNCDDKFLSFFLLLLGTTIIFFWSSIHKKYGIELVLGHGIKRFD